MLVSRGIVSLVAGCLMCGQALAQDTEAGISPASGTAAQQYSVSVQVVPVHEARLSSQMDGQVVRLPFREGDSFSKGQTLVEMDCDHQKASYASARASVERYEHEVRANAELLEYEAISDLKVSVTKAELEEAKAQLALARARMEDCTVVAPFDGQVVRLHVNNYENVSRASELADIVSADMLELEALVPSSWLQFLEESQTFSVAISEVGEQYPAKVIRIGSRIDPVSQTVLIRAVIPGEHPGLLPGMSGTATFGGAQ